MTIYSPGGPLGEATLVRSNSDSSSAVTMYMPTIEGMYNQLDPVDLLANRLRVRCTVREIVPSCVQLRTWRPLIRRRWLTVFCEAAGFEYHRFVFDCILCPCWKLYEPLFFVLKGYTYESHVLAVSMAQGVFWDSKCCRERYSIRSKPHG